MATSCPSRHAVSELPQTVANVIVLEPPAGDDNLPPPTLCDPNIKTITPVPDITIDPVAVSLKTIGRWVTHILPGCPLTEDLVASFQDGTILCQLLTALTGESLCVHPRGETPLNEPAALENLVAAFRKLKELGVDTRRCSFTDFSDGDTPRVATLLYRLVLWAEFDAVKWTGAERDPNIAVGLFESECEAHMIGWVRSFLQETCPIESPMSFADGEALGLLVAMQHYLRFREIGVPAHTFEQLFSTTKQPDYFRAADATAAEKCARALKVGDTCLGIPRLLDAQEVGREPTSLCIYLVLARKCLERYEAKLAERAEAKAHWAQVDEADAAEKRLNAELAEQAAELERVQALQAQAQEAAARAEQLEQEEQARFQAVQDQQAAVEAGKAAEKMSAVQRVADTEAELDGRLREQSKTLQAGLVSLEAKAKARSESLVEAQKARTLGQLLDMQERVKASRALLEADATKFSDLRQYDAQNVVPVPLLASQLEEAQASAQEGAQWAEAAALKAHQVKSWAEQRQEARAFRKAELDRQFQADQQLLNQEGQLTSLAICQSPQQLECTLHTASQANLEAQATHRAEFNAKLEREMQQESERLAKAVGEACEAEYRHKQVQRALELKPQDSALSVQRSVPHPLEPWLDDAHPLKPLLADTLECE